MAGITPPSVIAITLLVRKGKKYINQHKGAYAALAGRYICAVQDRTNLIKKLIFFLVCVTADFKKSVLKLTR